MEHGIVSGDILVGIVGELLVIPIVLLNMILNSLAKMQNG